MAGGRDAEVGAQALVVFGATNAVFSLVFGFLGGLGARLLFPAKVCEPEEC